MTEQAFDIRIPFSKMDEERREVTGWASVTSKGGVPVVDLQDDLIDLNDLRKAVEGFLDGSRDAGYMHLRDDDGELVRIGKIVGSLIIDQETAKALNMETPNEGWIITMKVEHDEVWKQVKEGLLGAFSIGGIGQREEAV